MEKKAGAIIIGGHFQGLGVIRSLAAKGIHCVIVDHEPCLSMFSLHKNGYFRLPPVTNHNDFLTHFIHLIHSRNLHDWVIFPTDDETVYFLSKHYSELQKNVKLITPPWSIVKYVWNKVHSYQLAEKLAIPIPKSFYPSSLEELEELNVDYPVILKPAVMRSFFKKTGQKVFKAINKDALRDSYLKAVKLIPADEIIIQEEIPEVSKNLYSFCPFFKNGKTVARIVAQRHRQHPMDFGHASTFAVTVDLPEIEVYGNQFLKVIDYYGLAEVEFVRDPRDGVYKFLEVNPRIWGWQSLAMAAGVNLPYLIYCDLTGRHTEKPDYERNVKWIRLLTDTAVGVSEILKKRMKISDFIHSYKGKKTFAVWSAKDPLPFFGELAMLPYLMRKRGF